MVGINITCQQLRKNILTNHLLTIVTAPHFYGKAMLVVAFDSFMRIIMIP
jgi:hypothetical protein